MPSITCDEVAHLANLARIELSTAELDDLAGQLDTILSAVAQVSGIATDDVEPMTHAVPVTNVFRDDVVRPSLGAEAALSGAPAMQDHRFRVPRILDEG